MLADACKPEGSPAGRSPKGNAPGYMGTGMPSVGWRAKARGAAKPWGFGNMEGMGNAGIGLAVTWAVDAGAVEVMPFPAG